MNLLGQSMRLGNGTHVQTVEGVTACTASTEVGDPYAKIEWTIRRPGSVD